MMEYNIYIVDLDAEKETYLYTTIAKSAAEAIDGTHIEFCKQEFGVNRAAFRVIPTKDDDRSRDDLIFDYIVDEDDSVGRAGGK